MKKTFKIKNYKGNLVESLLNFKKKYPKSKIVEAVEENDELRICSEADDSNSLEKDVVEKFNNYCKDFSEILKRGFDYDFEAETNNINVLIKNVLSPIAELLISEYDDVGGIDAKILVKDIENLKNSLKKLENSEEA